ncbi:MAG TPA: protein-glutamate O-methyltransferase [Paracoccaceae bacterium]|nr:protein-glutamate O-methyltransferase [Paracoccaceae bacterium]
MGAPDLTEGDFRSIAAIVRSETGIVLGQAKKGLVVSRLSRRLRDLRLPDFAAYRALIEGPTGARERRALISAMTTNVTAFFREDHHFRHLADTVLPPLLAAARAGGRVRLWSAGCSTGEEPYSLAITLLELCPEAARHDILILATDIDPAVLDRARAGTYAEAQLAGLSPARRARFLHKEGAAGPWRVSGDLQELIRFEELNLHATWPFAGRFDAILCRNVTIYFDAPTQARLWERLAGALTAEGHLYIGHSERIEGPAADHFLPLGQTRYRRAAPRAL